MSKFGKALRASKTSERALIDGPISISSGFFPEAITYANIWRIGAKFEQRVISTDEELSDGTHDLKVQDAKKVLIMHLFGEFIFPLCELQLAILNHESKKALILVDAILSCLKDDKEFEIPPNFRNNHE